MTGSADSQQSGQREGGGALAAEEVLAGATVLCVDDEPNILSSLRRTLRPLGCRVRLANGGREGLELMEQERVDLVISDMRMPEMDGAAFLAEVARRWPATTRILLTGYADLESTIDAINKGHIYRYLSKPWEDNDLRVTVQRALESKALVEERRRLIGLTKRQNEELKELNATLEEKVKARTEELEQTAAFLEQAYDQLKQGFVDSISVFSNLIELREGISAGHGRRVAELAAAIGEKVGIEGDPLQDLQAAALLHDIGKIGLPDELIRQPYFELKNTDRREIEKHPAMGEAALTSLPDLERASRLIRWHHERYDGRGFPDGLQGEEIPLAARVLVVANEFDALQNGMLFGDQMGRDEAVAYLERNKGERYDPEVVDALAAALEENRIAARYVSELRLAGDDLKPGMVLTRDLTTRDGMLLLAKDRELGEDLLARIRRYQEDQGVILTAYVKAEQGSE